MYVIHSTYFFMFSKKRQIYLPYLFDDEQRTVYVEIGRMLDRITFVWSASQ